MCENLKLIPDKSAIVYKIVARKPKGRRYYSIAMGFKYPELAGKVPKVKIQHCLAFFATTILDKGYSGYSCQMVGRTAGFVNREDAECFANEIRDWPAIYDIIVAKVKLTDELMSGTYSDFRFRIVAGRHIEWLK